MCRSCRILAIYFFLAIQLSASEPFFPMQPGNFWEYRTPDGKHSFRVRGFTPLAANGRIYYFVNGFAPGQLAVREEIGEGLKTYDSETGMEVLFTSFSLENNPQFNAPDRGCGIVTGKVEPNRVAGSLTTGEYPRMLQITYDVPACGEPVVQSEYFVANIGMVRRVVKVGSEIRQYDLVSARVGGHVILSKATANVTALSWQSPQQGDTALRFRLETVPSIGASTTIRYETTQ
ncbi:MAG: hypothetical protein KIT83_20860, partial [Bryobacterales bacterium]|nr:hypothetical protein [Bryobacterales bacterium]